MELPGGGGAERANNWVDERGFGVVVERMNIVGAEICLSRLNKKNLNWAFKWSFLHTSVNMIQFHLTNNWETVFGKRYIVV